MIDKLAHSQQVSGCYARSLLRFAYGLGDDERAECLAKQSEHAFAGTDGSLASLIGVLTRADLLLHREQGGDAEAGGDGESEVDAGKPKPDEQGEADGGKPSPSKSTSSSSP